MGPPSHNSLHTVSSTKNLGPVIVGLDLAVFSLSTLIVLVRLYTRAWITRNFGWDDVMSALTQAITACAKGFVVTEVSYGLGQHRDNLSTENYRNFMKYDFLDSCQFFWALATLKISICLFLLRLSQFDKLKRVLWAFIAFLTVSTLVLFLLIVLQCKPIDKVWDLAKNGRCFSKETMMKIIITQGTISFLTDFICAAFPIVLLRNLNIRRQSKIALCCLMGLGIITGLIAIARTATTPEVRAYDLTWVGIPNTFCRMFEVNVGNIAACVPILKPFVRYVHASYTGRDPHQILLRRKASMADLKHDRWYMWGKGFWSRRQSPAFEIDERHSVDPLPPNVLKMRAIGGPFLKSDLGSSGSLVLPVQGIRKGSTGENSPIIPIQNVRESRYYRPHRGLRMEFEGFRDVKDVV